MKNGVSFHRSQNTLDAWGQKYPAFNNVRNFQNGLRKLHDPKEVVRTDPGGVPYMPQPWPIGCYKLIGIKDHPDQVKEHYLYPFFVISNCKIPTYVWALDENGGYDHQTSEMIIDEGDGIHCSDSSSTWGCITLGPKRQSEADTVFIRNFVTLIRPYLLKGPVDFWVIN